MSFHGHGVAWLFRTVDRASSPLGAWGQQRREGEDEWGLLNHSGLGHQ